MLPEEFPVVLTVFMAMGAWRISRARVLTRRAAAIETLGSATVLCTDKTGTLTQNRMSDRRAAARRRRDRSSPTRRPTRVCRRLSRISSSSACSRARRDPFDPMEKAFHDLGRDATRPATEHLHGRAWTLVHAYGLGPDLLAMSHVWQSRTTGRQNISSPPRARPRPSPSCADLERRDARRARRSRSDDMAAEGLRVLGVARASFAGPTWPEFAARLRVRVSGPRRPGRSAARRACPPRWRMPVRRHQGGDDHRRLSGDGAERSRARRGSTPTTS